MHWSHPRCLSSISSQSEEEASSDVLTTPETLAALVGVFCLTYIVLMCVCMNRKGNKEPQEPVQELKTMELQPVVVFAPNGTVSRVAETNLDSKSNTEAKPNHASGLSGSNRPNSRMLPEPPASELPAHSKHFPTAGSHSPAPRAKQSRDSPQLSSCGQADHTDSKSSATLKQGRDANSLLSGDRKTPKNDYSHLRDNSAVTPSGYSTFSDIQPAGQDSLQTQAGQSTVGACSPTDQPFSPVIINLVADRMEVLDPYAKVKDDVDVTYPYSKVKDELSSTASKFVLHSMDYQIKEEDPYNHIGDSAGKVSPSVVRQVKYVRDLEDPYAVVQDDSAGDMKSVQVARERLTGLNPELPGTSNPVSDSDVYAPIHKKPDTDHSPGRLVTTVAEDGSGVGPPEPPRMYSIIDHARDASGSDSAEKLKQNRNYSQVTARESLKSRFARESLNPYETVNDDLDNTYTVVSETQELIPGATSEFDTSWQRLSLTSDIYAEIGISGGSLPPTPASREPGLGLTNNHVSEHGPGSSTSVTRPREEYLETNRRSAGPQANRSSTASALIYDNSSSSGGYATVQFVDHEQTVVRNSSQAGGSYVVDLTGLGHASVSNKSQQKRNRRSDYESVDDPVSPTDNPEQASSKSSSAANEDLGHNGHNGHRLRRLN